MKDIGSERGNKETDVTIGKKDVNLGSDLELKEVDAAEAGRRCKLGVDAGSLESTIRM